MLEKNVKINLHYNPCTGNIKEEGSWKIVRPGYLLQKSLFLKKNGKIGMWSGGVREKGKIREDFGEEGSRVNTIKIHYMEFSSS